MQPNKVDFSQTASSTVASLFCKPSSEVVKKAAIVAVAMLVLYGASVGLGMVTTALIAEKLVIPWQFGAVSGSILGIKATMFVALPILIKKCNMYKKSANNSADIAKFVKYFVITTAGLTFVGATIGALCPVALCKALGYKARLIKSGNFYGSRTINKMVEATRDYLYFQPKWELYQTTKNFNLL